MIVLIDNYDSFTYNIVQYLGELGAEVAVHRNDQITVDEVLVQRPTALVFSPGPGMPDNAGICLDLVTRAAGQIPMLGVCLGHQAIAQAFGGAITQAPVLMHGKISRIHHYNSDVFDGLTQDFDATRYHSLMVSRAGFPADLEVTAESEDGVIMGLAHRQHPVYGVQFHPESIESEHGHALLRNFLDIAA